MNTKEFIKSYIIILIVILILDFIWLGYINKTKWGNQIYEIQSEKLEFRKVPAILTYLLMAFVITYLGSHVINKNIIDIIKYGIIIGLSMYGVFNGTNYSIFKKYKLSIAITDTLWGCFLSTICLLSVHFIFNFTK